MLGTAAWGRLMAQGRTLWPDRLDDLLRDGAGDAGIPAQAASAPASPPGFPQTR